LNLVSVLLTNCVFLSGQVYQNGRLQIGTFASLFCTIFTIFFFWKVNVHKIYDQFLF